MEHIEAHSPEWHQVRVGKFTASRLYELICKPKDTPRPYIIEKVAEKLSGKPQDSDYLSDHMAHGVEFEPLAINWYSKLSGNRIEEISSFAPHPSMNFGATVDRNAYNKNGDKIILEIKCPASKTHIKYCLIKDVAQFKAKLPKYYWQIVGGALCQAATKGAFISFDERVGLDCGLYALHFDIPDEDLITATEAIVKAENEMNEILTALQPHLLTA